MFASAVFGKLDKEKLPMPYITVEGPKLRSMEEKRALVRELTEVCCRRFGLPANSFVMLVKEQGGPHMRDSAEALAVGGRLILDILKDEQSAEQ